MLVQKHREYDKDEKHGCFAVGKSMEEIQDDLVRYCDLNPDKKIYYYIHPIRPSKVNYLPEYMLEIEKVDKSDFYLMPFWTRIQ